MTASAKSGLLGCPFCGATPEWKAETDPNPPHNTRAWIKCPQCRQAQVCTDWYDGDAGTTAASWNARTDDTALLRRVREVVEQAMDCIRDETPEDCSVEEAREDTLSKLREVDQQLTTRLGGG